MPSSVAADADTATRRFTISRLRPMATSHPWALDAPFLLCLTMLFSFSIPDVTAGYGKGKGINLVYFWGPKISSRNALIYSMHI